jgi:uncharacterized protein YjbI with pentapeptide repeats
MRGAYRRGANRRGANRRGANLRGANLRGANRRGANWRGDLQSDWKFDWRIGNALLRVVQQGERVGSNSAG